MNCSKLLLLAGSLFGALTFSSIANASPLGSALGLDSNRKNEISAPLAYHIFCLTSPKQCRSGGKSVVRYNASTISKLQYVNGKVNRSIRFASDRGDNWGAKGGKGDCEDYALEKRRQLIAMGLPASALRIAAVKTRRGEGHAVLVVKTTKGDLILDNINKKIVTKTQAPYRWLAVATANPLKWIRL